MLRKEKINESYLYLLYVYTAVRVCVCLSVHMRVEMCACELVSMAGVEVDHYR